MTDLKTLSETRKITMLGTAFGPAIMQALADATVIEIIVNPDGRLWLERQKVGRMFTGHILAAENRERIIRLVASHVEQGVDKNCPIISAELPKSGERFEGVLPPIVTAPAFVIRKPCAQILTLDDYVTRTGHGAVAETGSYHQHPKPFQHSGGRWHRFWQDHAGQCVVAGSGQRQ